MSTDVSTQTKDKEQELSPKYTDRFTKNDAFFTRPQTLEGKDFFIFCDYGDYIKGHILARRSNAHINRTNSYVIRAYEMRRAGIDYQLPAEGQVEEFFANRQLQKIFEQNEVIGKCLRIEFVGKMKSSWSKHCMKVYRVFLDKGVMTKIETELDVKAKKTRKRA